VMAIPDTARSVHPKHSVAFYGIVTEVEKAETCWMYKLISDQIARSHLTVPEARVRPMPISLSDNAVIETRAFPAQKRLAAEKKKTDSHKRKAQSLKESTTILETENVKLRKTIKASEKMVDQIKKDNSLLANDAMDMIPTNLFSRTYSLGKSAAFIRRRLNDEMATLEFNICEAKEKLLELQKELQKTKEVNVRQRNHIRSSNKENAVLKRKCTACAAEVSALEKTICDLVHEAEQKAAELTEVQTAAQQAIQETKDGSRLKDKLADIKRMLTSISGPQAAALPDANMCKTSYNRLRQELGWMQEVLNAFELAASPHIRQINHDGGSIVELETVCFSVIITDTDNKDDRLLVLAAAALPEGKTAASTVAALEYIFHRHKEKASLFLGYLEHNEIDTTKFSSPEGITLKKLAKDSIAMSDNAAPALAASSLLIDRVKELVEADFTQAQLQQMSPEAREKLVRMVRVGCFAHMRCLFMDRANQKEQDYMESLMPVVNDSNVRMERTLNSLLFAIQKNFRRGFEMYAKGEQRDFVAFYQEHYAGYAMFDVGRAGTGSRMDATYETAYAVAMNFKLYIDYLVKSAYEKTATDVSILSASIKNRLSSEEYYAPLIARARFWRTVFAPLRVLTNCHDLEGHGVFEMGAVMDTLEEQMVLLLEDPGRLRGQRYVVFSQAEFPCLKPYYDSRQVKMKLDKRVIDLEIERLYDCGDAVEDLIDAFVVCMTRGMLDSIYHNAHNFLTSCDGIYSYENWNDEMREVYSHCISDNILGCESHIGSVDYHYRRASRFYMSTVNSLVVARHGKLFEGRLPIGWTEIHTEALIEFAKHYHDQFSVEEKEQSTRQEAYNAARLKEQEHRAANKILREALRTISYFTIPTLREIKKPIHLTAALKTLKSDSKKVDLLKMFITMHVIGFGLDVSMQFSSTKDKAVGKLVDLLARANKILSLKKEVPLSPPIRRVKSSSSPADFGLTPLATFVECTEKYDAKVHNKTLEVLELSSKYGINLLYEWDSILLQCWDISLSELQKKFWRDRIFREDGTTYKVIGLFWCTERKDYVLVYYEYKPREVGPTRIQDPTDRVIHSFFTSIANNYDGIDSWEVEWVS